MRFIKLGELCEVKGGKRLPKGHELLDKPTSHRYIRARDIKKGKILEDQRVYISEKTFNKVARYIVSKGDVVVTIVGANVGDTAVIPFYLDKANLTENAVKLCDFEDLDSEYLNYVFQLNGMKELMQAYASGSAQDKLGIYKIKELKIPIHSFRIQKKIASILSAYDDLIENNNQRIKLLEEMAEEIYKEWFLRMRFPGDQETKFYDKNGKEVPHGTLEALPEGWKVKRLSEEFSYTRGKSYSSEEILHDPYEVLPLLNLKNVNRNGGFRRDGIKGFSGKYSKNNLAHSGDVLMAVTDMTQNRDIVGRVARVPQINFKKFIFSMDLINIKPRNYSLPFTYAFFKFSGIGLLLKEFANGANVLHLTPDVALRLKFIMPEEYLAKSFSNKILPFLEEMDLLENKNQVLRETRDLLLPRLISGKLDVERLVNIEPEHLNIAAEPQLNYPS